MFIGREKELGILSDSMAGSRTAALVYGKRRVGKTTLIKQAIACQNKKAVYYECIKSSVKDNIDAFVKILSEQGIIAFTAQFTSFQDVFSYLNSIGEEYVIVIDEYPYLKTMADAETVDSAFQYIIDNLLGNISLVISGSHISIMREMLSEGNALYGRFSSVIALNELSYRDAARFYPSKTDYEKIGFHSVFGGSPFVLEKISEADSLEDNIKKLILNENSPVYIYAAHLLLSDYSNSVNAERVFAALGNGKKHYSELEKILDTKKTGNIAKQLKYLMSMDIVKRSTPINRKEDSKKAVYEINDNLIRFFFCYVYKNRSALLMIGADAFYREYIQSSLTEFISLRFEEQCRDFFSMQVMDGKLKGVRDIGSFYYDDPLNKTNGEFDVALEYSDHYALFEVKYYKKPLELDEIHREAGQVRQIKELNVASLGFISASGFADKEPGYIYYSANDLY